MRKGKIKIFYSYCHKDSAAKERLDIHLSQLKDNSVIDAWHDKKILAGAEWEKEINQHLNGADIVLFLLSADFLSSENCKKELKDAKKQGKRIIPIILNDCAWEAFKFEDGSELRKSQAIPNDGQRLQVISGWDDSNKAWYTVYEELKKVCDEFQHKTVPNPAEHIKDDEPTIPEGYAKSKIIGVSPEHENSLFIAAILGAWHENSEGDKNIIKEITDGF